MSRLLALATASRTVVLELPCDSVSHGTSRDEILQVVQQGAGAHIIAVKLSERHVEGRGSL